MTAAVSDGLQIHILAPRGKDAQAAAEILTRVGRVAPQIVKTPGELARSLGDQTGAIVIAEEALLHTETQALIEAIRAQQPWSDYPFIFLAGHKTWEKRGIVIPPTLPSFITNILVLERPMSGATLLSAVEWALQSRAKQFVTRDHLAELELNARHQTLLTRELAHRVKNTIAILQSIATQTLKGFPEAAEARDSLIARFAALAKAHDLLLSQDFKSAELSEIISSSISVHDVDGTRTHIFGKPVHLSPQSALSIALVIHELATNATKYGALSNSTGFVSVVWNVTQGAEPTLSLSWTEEGGPPVTAPSEKGFGSKLIGATLKGLGQLETDYAKTGFSLKFSGALAALTG